jgi:acetylornithine deacetylase/succinyl-diaminopimelate desuccinylase-like protein
MTQLDERPLLTWMDSQRGPLIELVRRLIQTRSENPPGNEAGMAAEVLRELKEVNSVVKVFEPSPGRTSVVGILESKKPGPSILCNAHLDTVPAGKGWSEAEPFSADVKRGRIYGRGASDHKFPIACLLYAVRALLATDSFRGRLVLVFDADEELGGNFGMRALLDSWNPKVDMGLYAASTSYGPGGARFFGIGTDNVFNASVGRLRIAVGFTTRIAYQVAPVKWSYAAESAAAVASSRTALLPKPRWFGANPRIRVVESSSDHQVWEVFVLPDESTNELLNGLSMSIRSVARSHGATASVELLDSVPPANSSPRHPLVTALVRGAKAATGRTPHVGTLCAYTGMTPIQQKLGIPIAAFGYGRIDLCHVPNEWVSVTQVMATARAYAVALAALGHSR